MHAATLERFISATSLAGGHEAGDEEMLKSNRQESDKNESRCKKMKFIAWAKL
jgi:hypothetical protein